MKPTETHDSPDDILGAIGVDRRCAIHEADTKGHLLMKESGKALREAYANLGEHITCSPDVSLRDHKDAEFRRLLDKIEEANVADDEAYIALQYEHEKIEDKFNKSTVEFFAKNPHPVITTVDQRIERSARTKTERTNQ